MQSLCPKRAESSEAAQFRSRLVASFWGLLVLDIRLDKMKKLELRLWNQQFDYLPGFQFACWKAFSSSTQQPISHLAIAYFHNSVLFIACRSPAAPESQGHLPTRLGAGEDKEKNIGVLLDEWVERYCKH
jgi:hypothetical protein